MPAEVKLKSKDAPDLSVFEWDDASRLEGQLREDERMLRDAAATCAQAVRASAPSRPIETR